MRSNTSLGRTRFARRLASPLAVMNDYSAQWKRYRTFNRLGVGAFMMFLSALPLSIALDRLVRVGPTVSKAFFIVAALIGLVSLWIILLAITYWRCPRCNSWFSRHSVLGWHSLKHRCVHCGLGIYGREPMTANTSLERTRGRESAKPKQQRARRSAQPLGGMPATYLTSASHLLTRWRSSVVATLLVAVATPCLADEGWDRAAHDLSNLGCAVLLLSAFGAVWRRTGAIVLAVIVGAPSTFLTVLIFNGGTMSLWVAYLISYFVFLFCCAIGVLRTSEEPRNSTEPAVPPNTSLERTRDK